MNILYFDCKNGISGDMVLRGLAKIAGSEEEILNSLQNIDLEAAQTHAHSHDHSQDHSHAHSHAHGRSWHDVKHLINGSAVSDKAKKTAINIYEKIAVAEAKVHGESLETIHFHEVGRDEAIKNALGIGIALEKINPDKIYTSEIYDGKGTIVCSHGEIPVPVPAVMALREKSGYVFRQADVNTEMVTPSGLASLMGIGAEPACENMRTTEEISVSEDYTVVKMAEAKGSRNTGLDGLKIYLLRERK